MNKSSDSRHCTLAEHISLRDYVEARIDALEKATTIAKEAMEGRLAGMNEFRDTLKDQASRFFTRQEMEDKIKVIDELRNTLKDQSVRFTTRQELDDKIKSIEKSRKDSVALGLAIVSLIIAAISVSVNIIK